ncbi:MAG: hypothetical protein PHY07_10480, partial [Methanosarcina sp.]|nr:hypothetical protein [Methanosarcina sp.]
KGADNKGCVAVWASDRTCGDIGFEGGKFYFMILFLFGNSGDSSDHVYNISVQCIKQFVA